MKYREYTRKNFKKIPAAVKRLLLSLQEYQWDRYTSFALDHKEIARRIIESNVHPFTIIIISELLDDKYWNNKKYVKITREQIISELDEAVFRHFDREINARMSQYLEDHNPTTKHMVQPSTQQAFVSDERDTPDGSSSVSIRQGQ